MPKINFNPNKISTEVVVDTKILLAARKALVPLRFGCASCKCGTCAVLIDQPAALSEMKDGERDLLARMKLVIDGSVRLACQAKVLSDVTVDISFQDTYSPDDGDEY